jgi:uncharacterized protein YlxW (UPF0749 family)
MKKNQWFMPITIVFLCMGIFLSVQYKAQTRVASDLTMQRQENLIAMIRSLSEKRNNLNLELADLSKQLNSQTNSSKDYGKLVASINEETEKLKNLSGALAVSGPGLSITISKNMPVLHVDLVGIINGLNDAGAEAISINDIRITSRTALYSADEDQTMFLTINGKKLNYPIIIRAIGNSNNLEKGLTMPGGAVDILSLFAVPELKKSDSIFIPALAEQPAFFFLSEYKPVQQNTTTNP